MSIARSTKLVRLTSNGNLRSIPIDHNYNRVCQFNLVPSENDISAIFKANRDHYYRKVLETVGIRGDYKHYTQGGLPDPRCNCILCWAYRRSWKPTDYPITRAKLLCMADQMREEYVNKDMRFDQFEKLTLSYRFRSLSPEMTHDMNVALWEILFPGVPMNISKLSIVDSIGYIVNSNLEIEYTRDVFAWGSKRTGRQGPAYTLTFRAGPMDQTPNYIKSVKNFKAVCDGDTFTSKMEERISRLQARVDKENELSKIRAKLRGMTPEEVDVAHQKRLSIPPTSSWFREFNVVHVKLVKLMFLHQYILDNVYASPGFNVPVRIRENKSYKLFNDVRNAKEKYKIFSSRISRADALIKAAERGFYFIVPELTHQLNQQYSAFNKEFYVFLNKRERQKIAAIFDTHIEDLPTGNLNTKMTKYFQKRKTEYMIQVVEKKLENHKDKSDAEVKKPGIYYIYELRKAIRQIRLEKSILMGRFGFGTPTEYTDCKSAVKAYIENLWRKIQSPELMPGYESSLKNLTERNRRKYIESFVNENMGYLYRSLSLDLKRKVDKRWVLKKLKHLTDFMKNHDIKTRITKDLAVAAYIEIGHTPEDEEFSEPGGFRDDYFTLNYIREINHDSREAPERIKLLKKETNKLINELRKIIRLDDLINNPKSKQNIGRFTLYQEAKTKGNAVRLKIIQDEQVKLETMKAELRNNPNSNIIDITIRRWKLYVMHKQKAKLERAIHYPRHWEHYWWFHGERNKEKELWQLSVEILSGLEKQTAVANRNQILRKAKELSGKSHNRSAFANEAIAELDMLADTFGRLFVNHEDMGQFILRNLPPVERLAFEEVFDNYKELVSSLGSVEDQERARMRFLKQMEPFKTVVFEKEVVKRAAIRDLKSKWNSARYREGKSELDELNPYEHQEWIGYKYMHKRAWLANNQKVVVFIDFNSLIEFKKLNLANKRKRSGEAELDMSTVRQGMRHQIEAADIHRSQLINNPTIDGKESTTAMCWIQHIGQDQVRVNLVKSIQVTNESNQRTTIQCFSTNINNVYENARDYKAMVQYRKDHRERTLQEKSERDKLIKLREERRQFVFGIVHADLVEQQKITKALELENKTAIMVYDPEMAGTRKDLFNMWTDRVIKATAGTTRDTGHQNLLQVKKDIEKECKDYPYKRLMFEFARKQWKEDNDIDKKTVYPLHEPAFERNTSTTKLRTENEQRRSNAAVKITDWIKINDERKESNEFTFLWIRFIEYYGRNSLITQPGGWVSGLGDMETLVRMNLQKRIEDSEKPRKEFLVYFKVNWDAATKRAIKRRKKMYRERTSLSVSLNIKQRDRLTSRESKLVEVVLKIIQEFIDNPPEQDDRIIGKSPAVVKYIQTELGAQVERILKTPLQKYTLAMWKNEVERSVARLPRPVFEELTKFVTVTKLYKYPGKTKMIPYSPNITEYQITFLSQQNYKPPVLPYPLNTDLLEKLGSVSPDARIAFGPGSWYKIDETSDMMRVTGLTMEERLLFGEEINEERLAYQSKKRANVNEIDEELKRIKIQEKTVLERKRTLMDEIEAIRKELTRMQESAAIRKDLKIPHRLIEQRVDLITKLRSLTSELATVYDFTPYKTDSERITDIHNTDLDLFVRKNLIEMNINSHSNRKAILDARRDINLFKQSLGIMDISTILKAKYDMDEIKRSELAEERSIIEGLATKLGMLQNRLSTLSSGLGDKNKKWKESDGNGLLHIIDDCVGEFEYVDEKLIRNGTDFPTHLRLNRVYYDTKAGKVNGKGVRKLVPFYIVSLYMKTEEGYERLQVRNRADRTFLPRHDKFSDVKTQMNNRLELRKNRKRLKELEGKDFNKLQGNQKAAAESQIPELKTKIEKLAERIARPIETSDYKGYAYSLCLSEEEFKNLTKGKQMDAGSSRMLTTLPGPFLHKYHTYLYKDKTRDMGDVLIQRKIEEITSELSFEESEMKIEGDDDPSLPTVGGLIHLKNNSPVDVFDNGFSIGSNCFDIKGHLIPCQTKSGLYYEDGSMFYAVKDNIEKLKYINITSVAIRSHTEFACIIKTQGGLQLWQCEFVDVQFVDRYIGKVPTGTMLYKKWVGDMLLACVNNEVWGFNKENQYARMLVLKGHTKRITSIAICEDKIATASEDKTIILWNKTMPELTINTRVLVKVRNTYRFGTATKKTHDSYKVKFIKDGEEDTYKILGFDPMKNGNYNTVSAHVKTLTGHKDQVRRVVWSKHLISSSFDNTVRIWRTSGKPIGELLFQLDFSLLGLPQRVNYTREQSEALKSRNQPRMKIAVVGTVVIFHYDKIVGKFNPETGKIIKFAPAFLNSLNVLEAFETALETALETPLETPLETALETEGREDKPPAYEARSMVWEDGMEFWTFRDSPHDADNEDDEEEESASDGFESDESDSYINHINNRTNNEPDAYISAVWRYEIARRAKKKGMTVKKYRKFLKRRRERRKRKNDGLKLMEIQRRERRMTAEEDSDPYESDEWEDVPDIVPPAVEQAVEQDSGPELMYWSTESSSDDSDRGGGESKN